MENQPVPKTLFHHKVLKMWTLFNRLFFFLMKLFQEDNNNKGKLKGNDALFILLFGPVKYQPCDWLQSFRDVEIPLGSSL